MKTNYSKTIILILLLMAPMANAQTPGEPYKFFRDIVGLKEEQIGAIRSGKALTAWPRHTSRDVPITPGGASTAYTFNGIEREY